MRAIQTSQYHYKSDFSYRKNPVILHKTLTPYKKPITPHLNSYIKIDKQFLNSKFNINFSGIKNVSNETNNNPINDSLDDFSKYFAQKIKDMMTPKDPKRENNCAIQSSKDIDNISKQFFNDGIGSVYPYSMGLNSALLYLCEKGQIKVNDNNPVEAFFIDESSIDYVRKLTKQKHENFENDVMKGKIKLYCLVQNYQQAQELMAKMSEIIYFNKNDTGILYNTNENNNQTPDAKTIKNTIRALAEYKFPNDKEKQREFEKEVCKYLDEFFIAFSYQTLYDATKEQYKIIESIVREQGRDMDDVVYLNPNDIKSYKMINYIYACANNIPPEKFVRMIYDYPPYDWNLKEDKIYVFLDDVSLGGSSFGIFAKDLVNYCSLENKKFFGIFSPIISSAFAKRDFELDTKVWTRENRASVFYAPVNIFRDFKKISAKRLKAHAFAFEEDERKTREYISKYKHLTIDDIDYLQKNLKGGISKMCSAIVLPYMVPDNSSDVTTLLAGSFLNNDIANKGVGVCFEGDNQFITTEDYTKLQIVIANKNREEFS